MIKETFQLLKSCSNLLHTENDIKLTDNNALIKANPDQTHNFENKIISLISQQKQINEKLFQIANFNFVSNLNLNFKLEKLEEIIRLGKLEIIKYNKNITELQENINRLDQTCLIESEKRLELEATLEDTRYI